MLTILAFSGKNWARSACFWITFVLVIDGLAEVGAETRPAPLATYNSQQAAAVLMASERQRATGVLQVAQTAVTKLDLSKMMPDSFGDADDAPRQR